jgi:hypothetical protein
MRKHRSPTKQSPPTRVLRFRGDCFATRFARAHNDIRTKKETLVCKRLFSHPCVFYHHVIPLSPEEQ